MLDFVFKSIDAILQNKGEAVTELDGVVSQWKASLSQKLQNVRTFILEGFPIQATWALIITITTFITVVGLASFLYGSFYYTYIPQSQHRKTLHFQVAQHIKVGCPI